jgi:hypothetical protein
VRASIVSGRKSRNQVGVTNLLLLPIQLFLYTFKTPQLNFLTHRSLFTYSESYSLLSHSPPPHISSNSLTMASEDPTSMFADMKKKKKKPKVAFAEDPGNVDADPTYPPKEPIDDPSLGPTTVHERVHNNENATGNAEDGAEGANMFADLKKKKKKKDLAADAVRILPSMKDIIVNGLHLLQEVDATPADGGADTLDFSDLKKKKKKKEVVESVSYMLILLLCLCCY